MTLFENLTINRIFEITAIINSSGLLKKAFYPSDYFQIISARVWDFTVEFIDNSKLVGKVAYILESYRLLRDRYIRDRYNYTYLNSDNDPIFSYDNSPHYPNLSTFPHHKHYYPKEKYAPVVFFGKYFGCNPGNRMEDMLS